ncbi:Translocon at the outer membrane of chloroplasts 64-V isoform 1 [Hibiscus syriacus]|uniref:Translocon at the outer membrane of chloroplasts 64-V isoform 1 n=1 Tax=Hibiscus syriacus TaxID=106335 RepID=A0A6A2WPK9_HIBSY|nr:Translocon at the outer membrane of chloroplasts 64-V isoform 1 [Hibiscus syriacus]
MVSKLHAVCIPFPFQGHVTPMLNLAKILHHKGFRITFVNTEYNHRRLLRPRGPGSLDGLLYSRAWGPLGRPELLHWCWRFNGVFRYCIDWMPGMEDLRFRDLPILNTFESLERDDSDTMSSILHPIPVYNIGPLPLLADQIEDDRLKHTDSNLLVEQSECVKWFDSKEPESVIYATFGSMAVMSPHRLIEVAWGLANSKQPFSCKIRPDLVERKAAILPPEFVAEIEGRGLLASWCPQQELLNHPSVGGFLSHMGWNLTILGIDMEIDGDVKRDQVVMLVRELMVEEKGNEMKAKAIELKKKAKEASDDGGFSSRNNLLTDVLCTLIV